MSLVWISSSCWCFVRCFWCLFIYLIFSRFVGPTNNPLLAGLRLIALRSLIIGNYCKKKSHVNMSGIMLSSVGSTMRAATRTAHFYKWILSKKERGGPRTPRRHHTVLCLHKCKKSPITLSIHIAIQVRIFVGTSLNY